MTRESRPIPAKVRTASISAGDLDTTIVPPADDAMTDIVRCGVCGHPVWSDESIRAGVGRDCRRALRRARRYVRDLAEVA